MMNNRETYESRTGKTKNKLNRQFKQKNYVNKVVNVTKKQLKLKLHNLTNSFKTISNINSFRVDQIQTKKLQCEQK